MEIAGSVEDADNIAKLARTAFTAGAAVADAATAWLLAASGGSEFVSLELACMLTRLRAKHSAQHPGTLIKAFKVRSMARDARPGAGYLGINQTKLNRAA